MLQADGAPAMMRRSGVADQAADPWEAAVYEAAEVGRWAGLRPSLVRRWLRSAPSGERRAHASFLDLIDLLFAGRFLARGLRLRQLRAALDEAGHLLGIDHFAWRDFFTDGHGIFLRTRTYGNAILRLLSDGQWVAADDIVDLSGSIDFDDGSGLAERWYPSGIDGLIVIDPLMAGGRPSIDGRSASTADVHAAFVDGGRSVAKRLRAPRPGHRRGRSGRPLRGAGPLPIDCARAQSRKVPATESVGLARERQSDRPRSERRGWAKKTEPTAPPSWGATPLPVPPSRTPRGRACSR